MVYFLISGSPPPTSLILKPCCYVLELCHSYNPGASELSDIKEGRKKQPVKVVEGKKLSNVVMNFLPADSFHFAFIAVTFS